MGFLDMFFIIVNLMLYAASVYIYVQFLLFLKANYLTRFTSGKLTLTEAASIFFGLILLTSAAVYGPALFGKAIGQGWNNFRSEMTIVTDGVVEEIIDLLGISTGAVYSSGPSNIIPNNGGRNLYENPDPEGGCPQCENFPTPTVPNPTPVLLPTPTLAPTVTPFNPGTWNPSIPPPTPEVRRP